MAAAPDILPTPDVMPHRRLWAGAHLPVAILLALGALTGTGCRVVEAKYRGDSEVRTESDLAVNFEQIRLRMRAQVQPMGGVVVAAADRIFAGTTNRAIRREALLWKIEAVPALREALYQPNPLTAVFDTWVLTFQMAEFFGTGPGREKLGDAHGIAVATSEHLEAEMARIAASMTGSGDITQARDFARTWAANHPMRPSIASRESTASRATEKEVAASFSATEAVGNLTVTADDLNRRLEIYSAQLPEQARWQAELLVLDLTGEFPPEAALPLVETALQSASRAVADLDRLVPPLERSLSVLEATPGLVANERKAAIEAVGLELTRTIQFVQEERVAALKQLTEERTLAVRDLRETLAEERQSLNRELDRTGARVVEQAFRRAAQLVAAALLALFLGLVVLLLLARRLFVGRP